jgi:hypothetical protein
VRLLRWSRLQVSEFLLLHDRGRTSKTWTSACHRWRTSACFRRPAQQIALQDLIDAAHNAANLANDSGPPLASSMFVIRQLNRFRCADPDGNSTNG